MYSNEAARANWDFYDNLKLRKTLWSPWFAQKYFNVVRAKSDAIYIFYEFRHEWSASQIYAK